MELWNYGTLNLSVLGSYVTLKQKKNHIILEHRYNDYVYPIALPSGFLTEI